MIKHSFRILNIAFLFLIFPRILHSQNNYSQSTIEKLQALQNNVQLALGKNDSLSIARSYYKLAIEYDYIGESDSCDLFYNKALSLAYILNNNKAIAVISNSLATTYSDKGKHEKAREVYSEVVDRFLLASDTSAAAGAMLNLSAEYVDIGEYEKGLQIAFDALNLKLSATDSSNIAGYYLQIGGLFNLVGNKQKWIEYTLIADSLAKQNEKYADFYRRMDILNELGAYYFAEEDYDKAENYYNTLFTQSTKNDYLKGKSTSLINLVSILKKQKKYSKAIELSTKALKLSESVNNIYHTTYNLIEIAKLDIILSENYSAKKNLLRAMELSSKYNYRNELMKSYQLLSEIHLDSKNYKDAYLYLTKYQTLKDSLESEETKQTIAELETKYQIEKKDNQINLLNNENIIKQERIEVQNIAVITIIVLTIFITTLFILIYIQSKLKSRNRILDLNQKLLRSQMNPHFIFNALIAIQSYILKNKKFEASDYLAKFASLMRSILESSREKFSILEDEIEILNYYVSLQQLRFENSFKFILEIDKNINTETLQIPPMIIQPFIENAIEHGLRKGTDEEKTLSVEYKLREEALNIYIEDNGIGIGNSSDNNEREHQSYAMKITSERLTNIKKIYKEKINVEIQDLSDNYNRQGTQVKFTIPLKLLTRNSYD
jgi:tetratricopeptide (TPR) repeat protein